MTGEENTHDHNHDHERIALIDEEGNEVLYNILLTFESDDFDKSYVLVYPASAGPDEEVEVLAFAYHEDEDGPQGDLESIETEEEWDMIEEVLATFVEEDL